MRVLIAAPHNPVNPYCRELGRGYRAQGCEVLYGLDHFWTGHAEADVVHLHWPELLVPPESDSLANGRRIAQRLDEWRRTSTVIATVHNAEPHRARPGWRSLFDAVYERCDGVVHHGERSREWFASSFPLLSSIPAAVVPHGNYLCFPTLSTRSEARSRLGIDSRERVVVVFGRTRETAELTLVGSGLRRARVPRLRLLISDAFEVRRLGWLLNPMSRLWALRGVRHLLYSGTLEEEEVHVPLVAADLLLIQRQTGLNSGNVPLAFSFGLPVISPDVGVFGELARDHQNFVFAAGRADQLALAIEHAFASDLESLGRRNLEVARQHWSWVDVAQQLVEFIAEVQRRDLGEPVRPDGRRDRLAP